MRASLALLPFLLACNNDYAIYADVSGVVVDESGAPVASAVVTRANAPAVRSGEEPLRAVTDATGAFRLTLHAIGSKPAPVETWVVAAARPGQNAGTASTTKEVPWSSDRSKCLGYCASDLRIVLTK